MKRFICAASIAVYVLTTLCQPLIAAEASLKVPGSSDDVLISATLSMPEDQSPSRAVLMLPVAGPADRDLTLGSNKIFGAAADRLAAAGIASLRISSRGVDGSTGSWVETDFETRLADARNAMLMLQQMESIRGLAVGVLGLSEGAGIAVTLAAQMDSIDFVVALSMPVASGMKTLRGQREFVLANSPAPAEQIDAYREVSERFLTAVNNGDRTAVTEVLEGPFGPHVNSAVRLRAPGNIGSHRICAVALVSLASGL